MIEKFIKSFTSDFDSIFVLEMDSGEILLQQCNPALVDFITEFIKDGYDNYRRKFAQTYLYPEDRDWFNDRTSISTIKAALENDTVYLLNHRICSPTTGKTIYYQTKFAKISDSVDSNKIVIGGHSIDVAERESMRYAEEMATAHHNAVIASLASDFDYICYVDKKTRHVRRFHASEVMKRIISKIDNDLHSYEKLEEFFKRLVYKEDYDQFVKSSNGAKVVAELEMYSSYEVTFRAQIEGGLYYYKLKFVEDKTNPDGIIVGLLSFDEQIRTQIQHREQIRTRELVEKQLELMIAERTAEIQEKNRTLNRINEDIIEMIGDITEARDLESGEHIRRVKGFTQILAQQIKVDWPEYNLTQEWIDLISSASALHDIGKIAIPDAILLKPGKLTPEEFEIMKTHTTKGCELLKKAPKDWSPAYLEASMEICHYHHEKYDGKGYPLGLKGDEIPLSAQIVSLADCYDALSSKRVYKDAFDSDTAYTMICTGKCGVFSPKLLDSFKKCKPLFDRHDFVASTGGNSSFNTIEKLAKKRILYVEDEELNRMIGREMLEGEGASVIDASNGNEALSIFEAVSDGTFDAILMDVLMPGLDGPETARIIRSMDREYAKTVPIIALTSSKNKKDEERCVEAGMNAFLTKPVMISELTSVLLELIKK